VSISAFFVPHYLGVFWEPLSESPADIVGGIVVVAILVAVNIFGAKESAGVNIFFAVADFLTQVLLVVVGIVLVLSPDTLVNNVDFGTTPTVSDFLIAIPVGMVAYTGIETISNMAEEARDYGTTIPRGIGGVVVAVAVIYAFLPAVALSAMPVRDGTTELALSKEEGGYADDPVLGVVENIDLGALQGAAEIYVGVLAATILFIATNAGLIGVSRLTYSMGQYRQLPEGIRRLHPKYRTPYVAILTSEPWRRWPSCRARRTSSARSTPSARCSRSPLRTCRSACCGSRSPTTSGPTVARATCASRDMSCRCSQCSEGWVPG